jgi:uroporphyrinogen decarboxylase
MVRAAVCGFTQDLPLALKNMGNRELGWKTGHGRSPLRDGPVEFNNMDLKNQNSAAVETIFDGSRFVRACLRKPVDRTPVWFLRQAGRYMQEYRDVRKHHTLVEICKMPELASEVTITAAEKLGVDAAIIFADLLLPLEPMGLDFEFQAGEGPVVHRPVRTADDVRALRTDRANELGYVARAIERVAAHFGDKLGIIGFCGAPYTLASYMIEGGGSRNYIETKKMMYGNSLAWGSLLDKLVVVLTEYCSQQVQAGADVIQIFDSWVGSLSLSDYRAYAFEASKRLVRAVQAMGVPVIYFGVETTGLLEQMAQTGADVIGLDWRQPLDDGWRAVGIGRAVQGNLDPITLFAPLDVLEQRVKEILRAANGRPGHIFNLGHGIVPGTPVENVRAVVRMVREFRLEAARG